MSWSVECSCGFLLQGDADVLSCAGRDGCFRTYDRAVYARLAAVPMTPAERYGRVRDLLHPPDGSAPLIDRQQALELLDTPAARPVRVGDMVTWGTRHADYVVQLIHSDGVDVGTPSRPHGVGWDGNRAGALLCHADGAPIDIEASLAAAAKVLDLPADREERLRVAATHREQVTAAIQSDDDDTLSRLRLETARANTLGDHCGDLQRERDEARAEVGRLHLVIAALERRAKR